MAYIEGFPGQNPASHTLRRLGRLAAFVGLVAGVFLISARDWRGELSVILPATAVIAFFAIASSMQFTPMAWKRIFGKKQYETLLAADRKIAQALSGLDDAHFVFHDLRLEFFHCEHLVIGPGGVFVIRRARVGHEVRRNAGALTATDDRLAAAARKLWQASHFLALVIKNGFKIEYLPQPLFVCPDGAAGAAGKVADVPLVALEDLAARITAARPAVPSDLPERLAVFLQDRYAVGSR